MPSLNLILATLFVTQVSNRPPSPSVPPLVSVMSSPLSPGERDRFRKERDKSVRRDDGTAVLYAKTGEFAILVERRLLPDDLAAVRRETLLALGKAWRPGTSVSLAGKEGETLRRGLVGQLPVGLQREALAVGAVSVHRSAILVLRLNERNVELTLDETPPLGDDLYPSGAGVPPKGAPLSPPLPSPPEPVRVSETLDAMGPATQSRAFRAAFDWIAARWRSAGERLRSENGELDQALDRDLAARNPSGEPRGGTAFGELGPALQGELADHVERNYRVLGFATEQEGMDWLRSAKTDPVVKRDYVGFGRWDQGKGGTFSQVRLFLP